ncbi:BTB/POZ domain-containing protein 2 [Hypsibius exemplaris]|uniref:BTB/POZ domain-containing protein 2 n=1 Tax=Hypsibius exemplaris TaxID=2072580 RepID=A0A1W0WM03_HYPEX|nr:BTB/POZ domain-containing protein 2 [Hypsibius exemplaris]
MTTIEPVAERRASGLPRQLLRVMGSISVEDELDNKPATDSGEESEEETAQAAPASAQSAIANWQCDRSSLLDRGQFLLDNCEALSDVVFVVGRGVIQREIPAHRFMLAMGSPVFETMFYGPTRQFAADSDIPLPDVEPAAFRNLLRFIYTDDITGLDEDTVLPTLYAAKKYVMPQLKAACVNFMRLNIRPQNVFLLLEQAQQSDEADLVAQCFDLIDRQTYSVISTDGFLEIDQETLRLVLQRDGLSTREVELWKALNRWTDKECDRRGLERDDVTSRRKTVGRALFDIRFPLMTLEELANGPIQTGILTAGESRDLFLHYFAKEKPELPFSSTPRQGACGEEYTVTRFTDVSGPWGYGGGADSIEFTVDHDIAVVGCGVYGASDGPGEHRIAVEFAAAGERGRGQAATHLETELRTDGTQNIFRIMFREPVVVRAGVSQIVSVLFEGPASHRGINGSSKISTVAAGASRSACTFIFSESAESSNGTSVAEGQIPSLYFCLL